jgi:hypothetical protein
MQALLFFKSFAIRHLFLQLYFTARTGYTSVEENPASLPGKGTGNRMGF